MRHTASWRRALARGPLRSLLLARAFLPVCLALSLVLVAGSGLQLASRFGWRAPHLALPALPGAMARHPISISGPGVDSASSTLAAYILGAVRTPGVYTLPAGALVRDLVQSAGGFAPDADPTRVDLAARVADGQEIYVPHVGEIIPDDLNGLVNLNTASAQDLHDALGITMATARRIVAYRAAHGSFTAVSQLLLVPISRTIFDRIKYLVTV
jgi:competence protein ComEA